MGEEVQSHAGQCIYAFSEPVSSLNPVLARLIWRLHHAAWSDLNSVSTLSFLEYDNGGVLFCDQLHPEVA